MEQLISKVINGGVEERKSALQELLDRVKAQAVSLRDIVASPTFGAAITSPDEQSRCRGMLILSSAVHRLGLDGKQLDDTSATVVATFFTERMADYATQLEVMEGIRALLQYHTIPNAAVTVPKLAAAVLNSEQVHIQSFAQAGRKVAFEIVNILTEKYLQEMQADGDSFVFGFIQAMDGEKDPRNLLLCFKLVARLYESFPQAKKFEADLFDITSCYFPITFTERTDDPFAIKKSDLIHGLRTTMLVSPGLWIRFLLDKLGSSIIETKLEVLETLKFALTDKSTRSGGKPMWEFQHVKPYLMELQSQLVNETMQSTDANVPVACMQVLNNLTQFIAENSNNETLTKFLDPLIKTCTRHFQEKQDGKLAISGAKILQSVSSASVESASIVFAATLPLIMEKYLSETDSAHKLSLLRMTINFCKAASVFSNDRESHPLEPYKVKIYEILKSATLNSAEEQERIDAIEGLAVLACLNSGRLVETALINEIVTLLVDALIKHTPQREQKDSINDVARTSHAALYALVSISLVHPSVILSHAIPPIVTELEKQISLYQELNETTTETTTTNEVAQSTTDAHSPKIAVSTHIAWLHALCDPTAMQHEDNTKTMHSSANNTSHSPSRHGSVSGSTLTVQPIVVSAIHDVMIGLLYRYYGIPFVTSNVLSSLARTVKTKSDFLRVLTVVLLHFEKYPCTLPVISKWLPTLSSNAITSLEPDNQFSLVQDLYNAFIHGNVQPLFQQPFSQFTGPASLDITFSPFAANAPEAQRALVTTFASAVDSSRPNNSVDETQSSLQTTMYRDICEHMFRFVSAADDHHNEWHTLVCRCIASILNKFLKGPVVEDVINGMNEVLTGGVDKSAINSHKSSQLVLAWVTKACIQQGLPKADKLWDCVMDQLSVDILGQEASQHMASLFAIFFQDLPQLPNYRALYKQKYFTKALARLIPWFEESSAQQKSVLLIALAGLLQGLPAAVMMQSASKVVPLLLQALQSDDACIKRDALSTFYQLIETDSASVIPHLQSLIPSLLAISKDQHTVVSEVRKLALECLTQLVKLPFASIYPFKDRVIMGLRKPLDDKKRTVRKEAVKCRNAWFVLSGTT